MDNRRFLNGMLYVLHAQEAGVRADLGVGTGLPHRGHATAVLVRQVLGAIAPFETVTTVAKLAAARKRKKAATGRCEGRKSHAELHPGG